MSANVEIFNRVMTNLETLVKAYRGLLNIVRTEKEILISANLDDLNVNNEAKEKILIELRKFEKERIQLIANLVEEEKMKSVNPSLLELANFYQGVRGEKLRNMHSVLELLIKRVKEFNLQNEALVKSALKTVTGAMGAIKDSFEDNKTYQKKGKIEKSAESQSGQLVRKQA